MPVSGISCTSTHLSFTSTQLMQRLRVHRPQFSAIYLNGSTKGKLKSFYTVCRDKFHKPVGIRCALDASFGDASSDSNEVFPRINVRDPFKRLGISKEASEEEIQAARNFLMIKYAGHKPSLDAIESAHDKIIMQSFHDRRKPKLHIKKRIREVSQSRVITAITSRFVIPSMNFIIKTAILFALLGVLTVLFPTEEGPTLQVAISLIATMYFVHSRLKSWLRASLYGLGAFFFSWLVCTFLMVSVMPPLLRGPRSLEVTTSLLTYVLLWVASTYLR